MSRAMSSALATCRRACQSGQAECCPRTTMTESTDDNMFVSPLDQTLIECMSGITYPEPTVHGGP